jgi:hypothetical protein
MATHDPTAAGVPGNTRQALSICNGRDGMALTASEARRLAAWLYAAVAACGIPDDLAQPVAEIINLAHGHKRTGRERHERYGKGARA